MTGETIKISATEGGEFDCYMSLPEGGPAPAVIIIASVFGVDDDVIRNCEDLAAQGFVAAAPDTFWRTDPGPMARTEDGMKRARARAEDRAVVIEAGVQDLADTIAEVKALPQCNGKIMVVGLCYGGPYAILGPARLGCDAGVAFHGTKIENYLESLKDVHVPVRFHWGDQDHAAPPETLEKIKAATRDLPNVEITVYPDILHGYTAPSSGKAWDEASARDSWESAVAVLNDLKKELAPA